MDFVIFFTLAVVLCVMLFEMTMAVFSMYNVNLASGNAARVVAISGELTPADSQKLYNEIDEQLKGRIIEDSLEITITTTNANTSYVPAQSVVITKDTAPSYKVNLGDEFKVNVSGETNLFHISAIPIKTPVSATSFGVGEVYFKK
ncbi:MAG: DUF4320 family protein [Candidatus Gastranaerophilaceae bacterium]